MSDSPVNKKFKDSRNDHDLITRCINTVRILSADQVEKAKSGHPGAPMGCAPIAHVLFGEIMKFNSQNPLWHDRDRFVLSNGHASALLYSMLHLTGYPVTIEDLKQFRQLGSITPGHPENIMTAGVEVSTGPLGQGITNAVGLAMAEKHLGALFNKEGLDIVNHFTYVLCGDGCLQEGISSEASSLAGHLGLGKLIVCYDDNHIQIDGDTELAFTEDVNKRYESYGWQVLVIEDGNDIEAIRNALHFAQKETEKPTLIRIRTVIGYGSAKEGTESVHGAPLGASDLASAKVKFGFDPNQSFVVDDPVRSFYFQHQEMCRRTETEWNSLYEKYKVAFPLDAAEFERRMTGVFPVGWKENLPTYSVNEAKVVATRNRSEEVLNHFALKFPELFGGSADLTGSNLTALRCTGDFQKDTPVGRYVRYGVREHAMCAISNGLAAHGGFRPFCATFLNFIGYALGAVRVTALSHFGVLFIMTHDSIGCGEDGPTHQPIEMLESLRALPNLNTIRPADGNEVVGAYCLSFESVKTPTVIVLSRQAAPTIDGTSSEKVAIGGYIVNEFGPLNSKISLILIGTGTELQLAVAVAKKLADTDSIRVRVVSMPCVELFEQQSVEYQLDVFPVGSPVMSIEAASTCGWRKFAHAPFGIDCYGLSAPGPAVMEHFGFSEKNLIEKSREVIAFYSEVIGGAPSLINYPRIVNRVSHH